MRLQLTALPRRTTSAHPAPSRARRPSSPLAKKRRRLDTAGNASELLEDDAGVPPQPLSVAGDATEPAATEFTPHSMSLAAIQPLPPSPASPTPGSAPVQFAPAPNTLLPPLWRFPPPGALADASSDAERNRSLSPAPLSPPRPNSPPITFVTPRTKRSYRALEEETQQIHQDLVEREQSDKQTRRTYQRRYENYVRWWEASQAELEREDSTRRALPALPITAAKVARFLSHEMTREKVSSLPCHGQTLRH